jgi:hypothetical protein
MHTRGIRKFIWPEPALNKVLCLTKKGCNASAMCGAALKTKQVMMYGAALKFFVCLIDKEEPLCEVFDSLQ